MELGAQVSSGFRAQGVECGTCWARGFGGKFHHGVQSPSARRYAGISNRFGFVVYGSSRTDDAPVFA